MAARSQRDVALAPPEARPQSLSEEAFLAIRDRIVTLRLAPGAVIDERAVMEELGFGRTPVREALTRLGNDGLVTSIPRRGKVVSEINITDLNAISEVRLELETLAARIAAVRATEADRDEARKLISELDEVVIDFEMARYVPLDQRVHRFVHRTSKNVFLDRTLERFLYLALRLWFMSMETLAALKDHAEHNPGPDELRKVLGGIIAGNGQVAAEILREHMTRAQHEILLLVLGQSRDGSAQMDEPGRVSRRV